MYLKSIWFVASYYLSTIPLLISSRQQSINGRYTRNIENYEFSVPHTLTITGEFVTFETNHYFEQNFENSRKKRSSKDENAVHLGIHVNNKWYHAMLWPNYALISPNLIIESRSPENLQKTQFHELSNTKPCYYRGTIKDVPDSRVALSTCDGLVGAITSGNQQYFIEPLENHEPNEQGHRLHVVFKRDTDETFEFGGQNAGNSKKCRASNDQKKDVNLDKKRLRRLTNDTDGIRFIETMIVCDKRFLEYHRDLNRERYILTVVNMASDYLHDTSIGQEIDLVLVRLLYLEKEEKELDLNVTHDARKTLESFCKWQQKFNPPDGNPAHADVALLFTRLDICHGSDCEIVGQSFVATPCTKAKNCAYCEDNGLELGLVVAHQIGHLLGALDDDLQKSGCPSDDPNDGTPYIMSPDTNLSAIRWSECSKKSIAQLFQYGSADCMTDRPPPTPYILKPVLPGVVYDWEAQCQLTVPGSLSCPTRESQINVCEELRCLKPTKDGKEECFSLGKTPADGTKCDDNMWCFQRKCVKTGQRPETVDGDWSGWSEWSNCTRTCGRGVSYALRECDNPLPANGGRYCDGDKIRYKICNSNSCPENATSFRQQQCDAYSDVPDEEGKRHKYKAFLNPEAPCSLWCTTEEGENEELNSLVKDGTRCKPGKKNVCVNGECWKVGCDNMLNSAAVEDSCGTCNGDGTGCKIIRDTFTEIGNKDYTTVTVFPIGAKKIKIEELAPSQNVIAVTDKSEKVFYLNGKYTEQNDGLYKFGRAEGVYTHTAPNQEKVNIKGPLKEELIFKVLFLKRENVGYKYQYAQMDNDNTEEATFHWEVGDMADCSARCGGGIQTAHLSCFEQKAGKVSDSFCIELEKPKLPSQHCNMHPCPVKWKTGKWSECDACKGKPGVRKRGVECIEENPNPIGEDILIENDRCPEPVPGTSKVCSSDKPCKGKRYVHFIPHSHLGDVWIKMQPKPLQRPLIRGERSIPWSSTTDQLTSSNAKNIEMGISDTTSTLPLVCKTENLSLGAHSSFQPSELMKNKTENQLSTERTMNESYALDVQSENETKLFIYPLKKTKDAPEKEAVLNDDKDLKETRLEDLEEDKTKAKTYKGKEAAKILKELVKTGKEMEEEQRKKNAPTATTKKN